MDALLIALAIVAGIGAWPKSIGAFIGAMAGAAVTAWGYLTTEPFCAHTGSMRVLCPGRSLLELSKVVAVGSMIGTGFGWVVGYGIVRLRRLNRAPKQSGDVR